MRSFRTVAATAACLALAACAHARKPDLSLPGAYEAPQGAPPAGAVALDHWWTTFNDPQLTSLIEGALAANPDARSAAARLKEARASAAQAFTTFLPQGDINGAATQSHAKNLQGPTINFPGVSTGGTTDTYTANFNVKWELDLFGRIFATREAAKGDIEAAVFDYEATRASLAAQTADSYFNIRGLAIQLDDANQTVRIEQQIYDEAKVKADRGLGARADADRVAGDLASSQAQAMALQAELSANERLLLILAGRTVAPTSSLDIQPNVGVAPAVPQTLPSQLLERRPDIREAEARVLGQTGRLRLANEAFFPTFYLTPGLGWTKYIQPGLTIATQTWSIGATGTQPILSIPNLMEQLHVQDARTEEAIIAYEKAVQTAFGEAETALVRLDANRRRVVVMTDGVGPRPAGLRGLAHRLSARPHRHQHPAAGGGGVASGPDPADHRPGGIAPPGGRGFQGHRRRLVGRRNTRFGGRGEVMASRSSNPIVIPVWAQPKTGTHMRLRSWNCSSAAADRSEAQTLMGPGLPRSRSETGMTRREGVSGDA
jgi:NodT family efflux transporter outer membrane factor (OMF) lipoprotein